MGDEENKLEETPASGGKPAAPEPPPRRGRGRPKGSGNKKKSPADSADAPRGAEDAPGAADAVPFVASAEELTGLLARASFAACSWALDEKNTASPLLKKMAVGIGWHNLKITPKANGDVEIVSTPDPSWNCAEGVKLIWPYAQKAGFFEFRKLTDEQKFYLGCVALAGPAALVAFKVALDWSFNSSQRAAKEETIEVNNKAGEKTAGA